MKKPPVKPHKWDSPTTWKQNFKSERAARARGEISKHAPRMGKPMGNPWSMAGANLRHYLKSPDFKRDKWLVGNWISKKIRIK